MIARRLCGRLRFMRFDLLVSLCTSVGHTQMDWRLLSRLLRLVQFDGGIADIALRVFIVYGHRGSIRIMQVIV